MKVDFEAAPAARDGGAHPGGVREPDAEASWPYLLGGQQLLDSAEGSLGDTLVSPGVDHPSLAGACLPRFPRGFRAADVLGQPFGIAAVRRVAESNRGIDLSVDSGGSH